MGKVGENGSGGLQAMPRQWELSASRDFLLQREDCLAWRGGEDVPRLYPQHTLLTFSDFLLSPICPQAEPSYQEKVRELVPPGLFLGSHMVLLYEEVGDLHKSAPELL